MHRTDQIIFPLTLQTTVAPMVSVLEGEGRKEGRKEGRVFI